MTRQGTQHGIPYTVVARQLERHRVVLEILQVDGQSVPLTGSPTFGSLQAALDIGSKLAEQSIGELVRTQALAHATPPGGASG